MTSEPTPEEVLTPVERLECRRVAERLAPFYKCVGWEWSRRVLRDGKVVDELAVPTEYEVEHAIMSLAAHAVVEARDTGERAGAMSGGLRVISTPDCAGNDSDDPNNPDNHLRFFVTVCP